MANGQAVAILPQDPPAVAEDCAPPEPCRAPKKQGFAVDEVKTKNGGTAVLKTKVKKGTWCYQVDIEFSGKELFGFTWLPPTRRSTPANSRWLCSRPTTT